MAVVQLTCDRVPPGRNARRIFCTTWVDYKLVSGCHWGPLPGVMTDEGRTWKSFTGHVSLLTFLTTLFMHFHPSTVDAQRSRQMELGLQRMGLWYGDQAVQTYRHHYHLLIPCFSTLPFPASCWAVILEVVRAATQVTGRSFRWRPAATKPVAGTTRRLLVADLGADLPTAP